MSNFTDHLAADRRLVILRVLAGVPAYATSVSALRDALPRYGHAASLDQVRGDVAWLAEQDLLTVQPGAVARLTERGLDVARGRATVPGVRRPTPDEVIAGAGMDAVRHNLGLD